VSPWVWSILSSKVNTAKPLPMRLSCRDYFGNKRGEAVSCRVVEQGMGVNGARAGERLVGHW